MNTLDDLLTQIAQRHLRVETLQTRHSDSLDFYDVSVWSLRDALEAAFNAGLQAAGEVKAVGGEKKR